MPIMHITKQEIMDKFLNGSAPAIYERILSYINYSKVVTFEVVVKFAEKYLAVIFFVA